MWLVIINYDKIGIHGTLYFVITSYRQYIPPNTLYLYQGLSTNNMNIIYVIYSESTSHKSTFTSVFITTAILYFIKYY